MRRTAPGNGSRFLSPEPTYTPQLVAMPWHELARTALRTSRFLVLVGDPGCGKTVWALDQCLRTTGVPAEELQGGPKVDDIAFFGRYVLEGDRTPFRDGPLARALKAGVFFILNDAGQVPFAQLSALLPLRHGRRIRNPVSGEALEVPDSFRIVLTTNPENASCRSNAAAMQSLLDGALVVEVPDLAAKELQQILLAHYPDATEAKLQQVLELRGRFQSLGEKGLSAKKKIPISVRAVVQLFELLQSGMNPRDAVALSLVGKFLLDEDRLEAARLTASMV